MDSIIITAPHAHCGSRKYRDCDRVAGIAAIYLANHLTKRGKEVHTFINDQTMREDCDMNRVWCRRSPYRQQITKQMKNTIDPSNTFLFDVHSFPPSRRKPYDLYILHHPDTYGNSLLDFVQTYGVEATAYRGSYLSKREESAIMNLTLPPREHNDIVQQAIRDFGIRALLIEFNESLQKSTLDSISKVIAEWRGPLAT